jgi:hypothetical protein
MNTFNDDRRDETDELSMMLNELPKVEPPPTLTGTVMSTIAQFSKPKVTQPPVNFVRRGSTMAKKVLWSVAAAAAAALVVMRVAGYPPVQKGTEATIGAAQRYQAPQVATADVKVEDQQLQAFLQSDAFRKLAADKAAQRALKNKDFQKALAEAQVQAALASPAAVAALSQLAPQIVNHAALDLASLDLASLDAAPRALLEAAFAASPAFVSALAAPGVLAAIADSSLGAVLAMGNAAVLAQPAALNALEAADAAGTGAVGNAAGQAVGQAAGQAISH